MGAGAHGYSLFVDADDLIAAYGATVADISRRSSSDDAGCGIPSAHQGFSGCRPSSSAMSTSRTRRRSSTGAEREPLGAVGRAVDFVAQAPAGDACAIDDAQRVQWAGRAVGDAAATPG